MKTRAIRIVGAVTAAVFLLIGCGDSGGSSADPTIQPVVTLTTPTTSTTLATTSTTAGAVESVGSTTAVTPTQPPVETTRPPATLPATTLPATTLPIEATNRAAVFADIPQVALLGPSTTGAGVGPTFEWAPVEGATSYRLSVLAPDGPIWVWEGAETSVALALRPDPRPASAPALEIVAGSSWSVAALDAAGDLLAVSGSRPVSPFD